ncbi:AMP-binding protein [Aromatoleum anaerobium]|uniref:AMP-binding protein n=1 Tax=Aromatoleum anaerobium TaxID=182180 RepID=A0ABX1PH01_9RHOO|nr:AMP-binding protein [Aromatoleum anaerobium]MCK0506155.1 AMP-binding protein [Aromatoleum anaerobium]
MNAAETLLSTGADTAIAIECDDEKVSYAVLRDRVSRAAGAWKELGLQPGNRVIVFAPDSVDWVVAYLGAIWAGGVAIGVNPRLSMNEFAPILNECEPRFVWCENEQASALVAQARTAAEIVANGPGTCNWTAHLAAAEPIAPLERATEDAALWIGTSGTTGVPKGVVHAQRTVADAHSFACGILGLTAADRLYASSKLFFAYALGNSLFAGLRVGATVILDREWPTAERVEYMVEKYRPTLLFSVPTLYRKMLQTGVARRIAKYGIRHYVSAGEALPLAVRQDWRDATGHTLISGYGTSETLCLMLFSDDDSGLMRPTPLTEVRYADDVDADVPQRLWIRHSAVALGYWKRPEAQADGFRDGWFSPGDMFLRHPDGRLEYTGRNDDMLKIAGQWVSTLWVEQSLASVCGETLHQIASVGVSSADGLTALAVLAVAAPERGSEARRRMDEGIATLPGHRRPRWVHWLDELPLTATGKLQRGRLRALHESAVGVS